MRIQASVIVVLCAAVLGGVCCAVPMVHTGKRGSLVLETVRHWNDSPRLMTLEFMKKYGAPDEMGSDRLVWNNNGPCKRTVVRNASGDMLEQTLACSVPAGKLVTLAAFDPAIQVSQNGTTLSVFSDTEEHNFLTVNLAYEVIHGIKDPISARNFYNQTIDLSVAGKSSPYMHWLLFQSEAAPRFNWPIELWRHDSAPTDPRWLNMASLHRQ